MHQTSQVRRSNRTFILLTVVVSFVLLIGALEAVVRVRQWVIYGSPTTLQSFVKDSQTGLRIPEAGSTIGRITVNSLGFRSPELPISKPRKRIRLAFLGASTTWCAEVSGNEMTWPHLVWEQLQEEYPDVEFDYLNAAVPGYSIRESLTTLESRVISLSPDIIIIYHATNDISYDTRALAKQRGIFSGKAEEISWLSDWSLAWFLLEKNVALKERQRRATEGTSKLAFDAVELSRGFERKLEKLVDKSQTVAPLVVLATFSHKFRKAQSQEEQIHAMNTSIYYMPYMTREGLFQAFDEYNHRIRDVAKKKHTILIEDENSIPGDDVHFNDSVHFKDAGSQRMAARVITGLTASPDFQKLLTSKS